MSVSDYIHCIPYFAACKSKYTRMLLVLSAFCNGIKVDKSPVQIGLKLKFNSVSACELSVQGSLYSCTKPVALV